MSISFVHLTFLTRSPGLLPEPFIPRLQQLFLMVFEQPLDSPQFRRAEAQVPGERDRSQPELCRLGIAVDMHVRRFVRFMAEKVHTVRTGSQYGRHTLSIARYFTASVTGLLAKPAAVNTSGTASPGATPLGTVRLT